MTAVYIHCDERYPDYSLDGYDSRPVHLEASEEKIAEWKRIQAEYDTMQEEIGALVDIETERMRNEEAANRRALYAQRVDSGKPNILRG